MLNISSMQYRHKIFSVILLFSLLPFLLFCTFYISKTWNEQVKSVLDKNSSQLKYAANQANTVLTSAELKAVFVNSNSQITMFLKNGFIDDLTFNMTFNNNLDDILTALNAGDQGIRITIFTYNNSYFDGNFLQKSDRLFQSIPVNDIILRDKLLDLKGNDSIWVYRKARDTAYNWYAGEECLCFYKPIMSVENALALIEVKIPFEKVKKQTNLDIPEGSFIIYDTGDNSSKNIIESTDNDQKKINKSIDDYFYKGNPGKYYVISEKIEAASHRMVMFIPRSYIFWSLKSFIVVAAFSVVLLIGLLIILVEVASKQLTKRLSRLIEKMNKNVEDIIQNDNADLYFSNDDIGKISSKIYELIQKVKEYYLKVSTFENEKMNLELEILQSRINPHFLYNTLSTMKWMCNNERLADMIDTMVKYYRLSLNKGDTILKISDELKMIEEYLKLQKFAFDSDFEYAFDIEEPVYHHTIIKHLLQPIVENAVLHGVNGLELGDGKICITGRIYNDKIIFKIIDNGIGMTDENIEQMLNGENRNRIGGYGVKNVQKRISLFYGNEYGIKFESSEGCGTTVIMTIPAICQEH